MIFIETADLVLDGKKCITSRLWQAGDEDCVRPLPGDHISFHRDRMYVTYPVTEQREVTTVYRANRRHWYLGQTLAVQPGRTQKAIGRTGPLVSIRRADVREFTHEDAVKEGFATKYDFLAVWCRLHDKSQEHLIWTATYDPNLPDWCPLFLRQRPDHRYDAWVLAWEPATVVDNRPERAQDSAKAEAKGQL